ncbi:hypothetical protein A9P82_09930 [Arachidicoccus ginsenosidimutans]|uniref:addiction module protein n=1 Tax=Arachidicoccus sp. BS20 TaxID=1850526 RepID=UPI0007F163F1|nr:addiction module protein [Arachidicoccus sp. BS20]ANI89581.1 hypothetical protein A9P82_09930 [Arachidicoccus sp. BS20]
MENIHPQYTFDNAGNPVGVFLPIDDWNAITEELHLDLPEWQKRLLDERVEAYRKNPEAMIDWDSFVAEELSDDE